MDLLGRLSFPVIKLPRAITKMPGGDLLELYLRYAPSFDGRATRSEWFGTLLATLLLYFVFVAIGPWTFAEAGTAEQEASFVPEAIISGILIGLPLLSATVRRLHDTRRRWWALFVVVMPYVGGLVLFAILMLNSDAEENEFGPPPPE